MFDGFIFFFFFLFYLLFSFLLIFCFVIMQICSWLFSFFSFPLISFCFLWGLSFFLVLFHFDFLSTSSWGSLLSFSSYCSVFVCFSCFSSIFYIFLLFLFLSSSL